MVGDVGASYLLLIADMPHAKRVAFQKDWMAGKIKVLCCTISFGLGVDKSDIRYVIHHTMPSSLEAYYQQTGRAVSEFFQKSNFRDVMENHRDAFSFLGKPILYELGRFRLEMKSKFM